MQDYVDMERVEQQLAEIRAELKAMREQASLVAVINRGRRMTLWDS